MRASKTIREILRPTANGIAEGKLVQGAVRNQTSELEERIKEQNCMYGVSSLTSKQDISLEEVLNGVVAIIPPAWQHPEIVCAHVILRGQEVRTDNFVETKWKQASDIVVNGEHAGRVEVFYLKEKPESDEGPFLSEKRELLDAVAEQLGRVAERKQAGEALQQREREYKLLLDCTIDGLTVIDIESAKLVFCNQRAATLFGFNSPGETIGVNPLSLIHPEDIDRIIKIIAEELSGKRLHDVHEFRTMTRDGRCIWMKAAFRITDYQGKSALVVSLRPRPERNVAGNEIGMLDEELEQRVTERTWQLQAVNKELEAFAYSVSHDLRAPLRSIEGFSQVLLEDYAHWLDTQGRDYLQRICSASRRMAQLIDDLLNFSRVTRVEMQRDRVDLSALAHKIVAELQQSQPERQADFIIMPGLVAKGDSHLLRVALENLLGNA